MRAQGAQRLSLGPLDCRCGERGCSFLSPLLANDLAGAAGRSVHDLRGLVDNHMDDLLRSVAPIGSAINRFHVPKANRRAAEYDDKFDVALIGVPFDGGVSYRPGARFGPGAVREYSALGRNFHMSREVDWVERLDVADVGDCPTVPVNGAATYAKIEETFAALHAAGKRTIAVGGDHSCTLAILRAVANAHGPLNFIHFDAHLDTYL